MLRICLHPPTHTHTLGLRCFTGEQCSLINDTAVQATVRTQLKAEHLASCPLLSPKFCLVPFAYIMESRAYVTRHGQRSEDNSVQSVFTYMWVWVLTLMWQACTLPTDPPSWHKIDISCTTNLKGIST